MLNANKFSIFIKLTRDEKNVINGGANEESQNCLQNVVAFEAKDVLGVFYPIILYLVLLYWKNWYLLFLCIACKLSSVTYVNIEVVNINRKQVILVLDSNEHFRCRPGVKDRKCHFTNRLYSLTHESTSYYIDLYDITYIFRAVCMCIVGNSLTQINVHLKIHENPIIKSLSLIFISMYTYLKIERKTQNLFNNNNN